MSRLPERTKNAFVTRSRGFRLPRRLLPTVAALTFAAVLLALHARYGGGYGRLGKAGLVVTFVGYALLFLGSVPAVLLGRVALAVLAEGYTLWLEHRAPIRGRPR